ncbi:MAG: ABC transporter permease [Thermomicrobiales bacterium]
MVRFRPRPLLFWVGTALFAGILAAAILAPWLAPHDPRLPTGRPLAPPTHGHLLGTNDLGQDTLSQLLFGARSSLLVAGSVAAISTTLSWSVGLAAGLFRRAEAPLMMVVDLLLALPSIPLYLLVLTLLGPSRRNLVLVLAVLSWPGFARVVQSVAIGVRSAPYVEAGRALGARETHIIRRHLLPATLDVLPTKLVLTVRFAVFAEATLGFLGLSSTDAVSWGTMLNWAFADPLLFARPVWPWLVLPPTLAIVTLILATVGVGTGLTTTAERHAAKAAARQTTPRPHGGSTTSQTKGSCRRR